MRTILFIILFFFSCCNTDFFLYSQRDRLYDAIWHSSKMWELGLEITKKKDDEEVDNLIMISKNLSCEEPELLEYKDYCRQEIEKLKNDYNEIMAFCLTENDEYGIIRKSTVVINDAFFYSLNWPNSTKENVVAHEIGHCLGLKHVYLNKNIMFPFQENGTQRFNPQKTILRNYYFDNVSPSKEEQKEFFQDYKQYFLRYEKIPLFYVKL